MAENQSATEDSGQQVQQHHHQQQQQEIPQQHLSTNSPQDEQSSNITLESPTATSPQDNSASSPEENQTTIVAPTSLTNHHNQQQHHHHQNHLHHNQNPNPNLQNNPTSDSSLQSRNNMLDRQMNAKLKNSTNSNYTTTRRSSLNMSLSTTRSTNTTSIKKAPLSKMTSLTSTVVSSASNTDIGGGKHRHQHHQHNLHYHQHHHSQHNNTVTNHTLTQRTTSESLRLNTSIVSNSDGQNVEPGPSSTAAASPSSMSNATSNSSLHNSTTTRSSSSTSLAPQSTATAATNASSSSTSRVTSPNNNNNTTSSSTNTTNSRSSHHSHHSHHSHGHQPQSHINSGHQSTNTGGTSGRKPRTTSSSFQITSVTVGGAANKLSSENGEESADDLDESHTDDNSSRVTDIENETPSMSEDTSFSKEEVYFSNSALSTSAPVIPTSAQYGLVVVDPIGPALTGQTIQNVQVNVADNIINVVSAVAPGCNKKKDDLKEAQQRSERFKVVKIESTEPFRRGRWMCMDYLDHSSVGGGGNTNEKTASGDVSEGNGNGNGSEPQPPTAVKTTQSMIIGPGAAALLENHADVLAGNSLQLTNAEGNWNYAEGGSSPSPNPMQQQMQTPSGIATAPATVVHGMQQFLTRSTGGGSDEAYSGEGVHATSANDVAISNGDANTVVMDYATAAAQQLQQSLEQLKKQEEAIAASLDVAANGGNGATGALYTQGQSQPVNFSGGQPVQHTHQQTTTQQQQSATLPSNLLNIVANDASNNSGNSQINNATPSPRIQQQNVEHDINVQQTLPQQQQQQQQQQPMSPVPTATSIAPTYAAAAAAGAYSQQHQSFQTAQQQQSPPMVSTNDAISLQQNQQAQPHQQQNATSSPQRQQPTSQTDGITTQTITSSSISISSNTAPQYQQQPQPQTTASITQGQTLPTNFSQMTNYEVHQQQITQQQQQQQSNTNLAPSTSTHQQHQQLQSAPATISDPNVIVATLQTDNIASVSNTTLANETIKNNNGHQSATNATEINLQQQKQQQQQPPQQIISNATGNILTTTTNIASTNNAGNNGNNNNINGISNGNIVAAVGSVLADTLSTTATGGVGSTTSKTTSATPASGIEDGLQLQQLQQNPETETESSISSYSQNTFLAANRKRAHSTPFISPNVAALLNPTISLSINNTTNVHYYSNTPMERTSFCVDDTNWPSVVGGNSDSNIYTNIALGDERYKLPNDISTDRESSLGPLINDEFEDFVNNDIENVDYDEAADQFSPSTYASNFKQPRSIPIPISAGNSSQHNTRFIIEGDGVGGISGSAQHLYKPLSSSMHMAYSASPTTISNAYSPFYCGSPDIQSPINAGGPLSNARISCSYDQAYGASINRLPLPLPLHQQRQQETYNATQNFQQRPATIPSAVVFSPTSPTGMALNSASGTSAVAIDNKIEQAMDLVKSHLMIAVREEVEVLKERISELMDKINQLEVENTILKANISQETLQQLQLQIAGSASSTAAAAGNNMLTAPPSTAATATATSAVTTPATAATQTVGTTATATNSANPNVAESTTTTTVENVNSTASVNVNNATTTANSNTTSTNDANTTTAATIATSATSVSNNAATNGPMP